MCCSDITHPTPPPLLLLFALKKVGAGRDNPVPASTGKYIAKEIKHSPTSSCSSCRNIHQPILQISLLPPPSSHLHLPSPYPAPSDLPAIVVRGAGRGFLCCSAINHTTPPLLLHLFALKKVGRGVLFPASAGKYI